MWSLRQHGSGSLPHPPLDVVRRLVRRVQEAHAVQAELYERVALRQEPWREELLHWSFDGGEWRLHGSLLATSDAGRLSVTRTGWCPGLDARTPAI